MDLESVEMLGGGLDRYLEAFPEDSLVLMDQSHLSRGSWKCFRRCENLLPSSSSTRHLRGVCSDGLQAQRKSIRRMWTRGLEGALPAPGWESLRETGGETDDYKYSPTALARRGLFIVDSLVFSGHLSEVFHRGEPGLSMLSLESPMEGFDRSRIFFEEEAIVQKTTGCTDSV